MKILVFQHIACEHPGIFREFMNNDGIQWDSVELDEGEAIPSTDDYDALMVMGGPMDVWQKEENPWLIAEIEAIREWVVVQEKPYLGFCLGHQLLAEALGGTVGPSDSPEIGVLTVELTEEGRNSPFLKGCPTTIPCLQWHSAEVTQLPDGATILAESGECAVNAMSYGSHAFSVQFHVELTHETVSDWGVIPEYKQALEKALGQGALENLDNHAQKMMPEFNRLSEQLYHNFKLAIS